MTKTLTALIVIVLLANVAVLAITLKGVKETREQTRDLSDEFSLVRGEVTKLKIQLAQTAGQAEQITRMAKDVEELGHTLADNSEALKTLASRLNALNDKLAGTASAKRNAPEPEIDIAVPPFSETAYVEIAAYVDFIRDTWNDEDKVAQELIRFVEPYGYHVKDRVELEDAMLKLFYQYKNLGQTKGKEYVDSIEKKVQNRLNEFRKAALEKDSQGK